MIELFGERVLALLTERGMTQRELAEATGLTEVTISRYMTGLRKPKADNVVAIAEVLGVTTDYLLRGKTEVVATDIYVGGKCSDCTRRKFYMDGYRAGQREMKDELLDFTGMLLEKMLDEWDDRYRIGYQSAILNVSSWLLRRGVADETD